MAVRYEMNRISIKAVMAVLLTVVMIPSFFINVHAETAQEVLDELEKSIPAEYKELYNKEEAGFAAPSFSQVSSYILKAFSDRIKSPLRTFSSLLIIIVFSSLFKLLSEMINSARIRYAFELACALSMTLSILSSFNSVLEQTRVFLDRIADFSLTLAPLLCGICIASGNVGAATVSGNGISVFVTVCEQIFSSLLYPMISCSMAFCICSGVNSDVTDISSLSSFIRRMFSAIVGFILMLYCAVISYQSIITSSADTISARTVRFAIGNAVPVVGASLGEAMRTVMAALSSLKGSIGGVGISVVLLMMLPCIISLLLERTAISAASSLCGLFGLKKEAKLLEEVVLVYGYAAALSLAASGMLVFMLSIVSAVSVNSGGV